MKWSLSTLLVVPEQTDPLILMWKQNQGPLIPLLVLKSRFLLSLLLATKALITNREKGSVYLTENLFFVGMSTENYMILSAARN